MRVLYVHQHFSTRQGATGTRSYEFARTLIGKGHHVTMLCGSAAASKTGLSSAAVGGLRRGRVDGIDVIEICLPYSNHHGFLRRSVTFVRFALRSIRIAWQEPYDLMYATSTPLTAGLPGIAMRLLWPERKFVFEVRDLWPELPKAMGVVKNPLVLLAMSALEKATYLAMHAGVALSPGIQRGMRRRTPVDKPIEMIPNGSDTDVFTAKQSDDAAENRLPIDAPPKALRCVFTGAHGRANGLDAVLDAARELKARGRSDIQLVFIGDGSEKSRLVQRKESEGLTNCSFLAPVPKSQLATFLNDTDVGLMILANVPAFYYGTSPNKFFDYIAAGLPVLTNYPGWLAELIDQHGCGRVVRPDDPQAFADALCWMADHRGELRNMGLRSRQLAESEFERRHLADRFVRFVERVAAGACIDGIATDDGTYAAADSAAASSSSPLASGQPR